MNQILSMEEQLRVMFLDVCQLFEVKTKEYGDTNDIFQTIERVSAANDMSDSRMCMILCSKHFVSLLHDIDDLTPSERREKVNDIHLYMEYAMALVDDETR